MDDIRSVWAALLIFAVTVAGLLLIALAIRWVIVYSGGW